MTLTLHHPIRELMFGVMLGASCGAMMSLLSVLSCPFLSRWMP